MQFAFRRLAIIAIAAVSFGLPASAHITFENKEVKPGATVKFVLRVPHGCDGAATTAVRIALPESLSDAKPQPKPGWTLSLVTENVQSASATPGHNHGGTDSLKEIAWTGGRLEDAHYDEFVFRAAVSRAATGRIFVPVVQQCDGAAARWIEIPTDGGSSDNLKHPAPSVRVEP
ncbi:YcnI family protein [Agrobacterium rhizogenes]|nr:YcnI family protein [Rhizobium rhizogenes]NTJ04876.1 YcnI family protein [Rhizobium rhizogenes]